MPNFLDIIKSSEREHSYLGNMEPEQVLNEDSYRRALIMPHQDYFELRIPETFLQLERKYWKDYSPMTVVMLRFLHNGNRCELPFVISSQTLLDSFSGDTQGWSEFYNVRALGPFPYEEGDVELAVALYAVESRDYAGELFSLADKLLNTLQVPLASQVFETADVIKDVIEQLTGLDKVSRKLGFYQAFQPNQFRDQYLLKINAEQQQVEKETLRVLDGRLHTEDQNGKLQRVSEWDYCLTRILASDKTLYTQLPFWETWQTVRRLVNEGNERRSQSVCDELLRQITMCPDLTDKDRKDLPFLFKANFEKETERFEKLHGTQSSSVESFRAGYRTPVFGASGLAYTAMKLRESTYPSQIHKGLKTISKEWSKIPGLGAAGKDSEHDLSSELIGQQLDQIRTLVHTEDMTPSIIADALTRP